MNIFQLLFESKLEYIARSQGTKLEQRAEQDVGSQMPAVDVLNKLLAADPSGDKGKNLQWLVNLYLKGQFKLEDVTRIKGEIETFQKVASKLAIKDLNQYKSLPELYTALKPFEGQEVVSNREADRQLEQKFYASKEAILRASAPTKIIEIHSEEAAVYFGRGTKWCTAASEDNLFNHYYRGDEQESVYDMEPDIQENPLFVIIFKGEKYQWHPETEQFMDALDQHVTRDTVAEMCKDPAINDLLGKTYEDVAARMRKTGTVKNAVDLQLLGAYAPDLIKVARDRIDTIEETSPHYMQALNRLAVWFEMSGDNRRLGTDLENWLISIFKYDRRPFDFYGVKTGFRLTPPARR